MSLRWVYSNTTPRAHAGAKDVIKNLFPVLSWKRGHYDSVVVPVCHWDLYQGRHHLVSLPSYHYDQHQTHRSSHHRTLWHPWVNILPNTPPGQNKLFWAKFSKIKILRPWGARKNCSFSMFLDKIHLKLGIFLLNEPFSSFVLSFDTFF